MTLLRVLDLEVTFPLGDGRTLRALHAVTFSLDRGQSLALVGESGSGKSTIAKAIVGLVSTDAPSVVMIDSRAVLRRDRAFRRKVQMVFQDPFSSLNPAHTILHHLERPLRLHGCPRGQVRDKAAALLDEVGLRPGADWLDKRPHSLSGGQRQRVAIARALAPEPDLLIADEPTSMLDVSIRTEVLQLLDRLRRDRGLALLLITHDLAAARLVAERTAVLYAGQLMELERTEALLTSPRHPYTQLLVAAAPRPGGDLFAPLPGTSGTPPTIDPPPGCPFAERCPKRTEVCAQPIPKLGPVLSNACHLETD